MPEMLSGQPEVSAPGGDLEAVLANYLRAAEDGRAPDRMEFLARHPDLAPELATFFAGQDQLGRLTAPLREAVSAVQESTLEEKLAEGGRLGDFRIQREIGRGGMGVVYEAEQISLGRRVALKVLPFASALDGKQLQRFKNEAQAAAGLQHTNIVPVYFVGCERGVHFYAMQFVEGQTLAALIQELRQLEGREAGVKASGAATKSWAAELISGQAVPPGEQAGDPEIAGSSPLPPFVPPYEPGVGLVPSPTAETITPPVGALSPEHSTRRPAFFRTVANLGIQAAEALEHAHSLGVIHRDIKPANLMVEGQPGGTPAYPSATGVRLWITDFGLAHCQGGSDLTMSGDLLGTLRYMSPEQALAKRVIVDERTDIYSLGATLYELLTLEAAFPGTDRQEVLRKIAFEDPKPPRRLNKTVPVELETIVLKAMEKNPAERYATAQELAGDLERYLKNEPIRARRPSLRQRAVKWVRRHKAVSWMAMAALAVLAVGSSVSALIIAHQWNLAEQGRKDADDERRVAQLAEKRANYERDRAKRSEEQAEAINQFLVKNILTFSSPGRFGYRESDTTVAQALEEASRSVETAFPGQPELEASVRLTIGNTYFLLGRFKEAEQHLRRGLELRGDLLSDSADPWGREYAETAFATKRLGLALQELGRKEEAKPFLLRGGEARRRVEIRRIPFKVNAFPFTLHPLGVVFSPDGRWLLVSGDDDCLRLYDVATGMEIHRFVAHVSRDPVGMAFSPDGRHALSGGDDTILRLWDVYTAKEVRQFTGHTDRVHFVAFSPDGRHALSASLDKTLRLWDVQSGEEIRKFLGHTDVIYNAAFSPDGRRVLSASKDETMRLWEVGTGLEIRCFPKAVGVAVFSPDGRRALSTHEDGLRVWDVETGEELRRIPDSAGLGHALFTPDGLLHAVSSGDTRGKWCLWDLDAGKEVRSYYVEPPLRPKGIEVSPDGRLAVCGNWRGSISIWRMGDPPAFGQELAEAGRYYDQKRREFGPDAPETLQALDELAALFGSRRRLSKEWANQRSLLYGGRMRGGTG